MKKRAVAQSKYLTENDVALNQNALMRTLLPRACPMEH